MKVLVTANFTDQGLARLKDDMGMEVVYDPWGPKNRIMMSEDLAELLVELKADALILEVDLCHEEVFEECNLKFIGCCRGEPLNVDVEEATDRGIPVFFTPGRNADAVADMALAYMLCHLRFVIDAHNTLMAGKLDPESIEDFMALFRGWTGCELGGKKVGIIGIGAVGSAVARRVKGFGSEIIAYDPFAPEGRFQEFGAKKAELMDIFKEADIITIHASDADENQGMITREMIEAMKPDAFFINLARAGLVDNEALYNALKDKKIKGAALDVFQSEPPRKDDPFLSLDNVIVTPHLGGATHDVVRHQTDIVLADIQAFLKGEKPRFCANPEVLEKK